jgi:hypothetical protein
VAEVLYYAIPAFVLLLVMELLSLAGRALSGARIATATAKVLVEHALSVLGPQPR